MDIPFIVQVVVGLLLFMFWAKTTDWVSRDSQLLKMPHVVWNCVVFFSFAVCLFLFWPLLGFVFASVPMLMVGYFVPILVYVVKRNKEVDAHERVLTSDHIRFVASHVGKKVGLKIAAESKKDAQDRGPAVAFTAMGGATPQDNTANLLAARQMPGFATARKFVVDSMSRRADKFMLDYGKDVVAVRFQIDGVWHEGESHDRETGDSVLTVFKQISSLNVKERRARQQGKFKAGYEGVKLGCSLVSQGTKTGERVMIQLSENKELFATLDDLGMREKMQGQLKEHLGTEHGLVLFSAMPSGGLTTTMTVALKSTDRYMRHFVIVEDEANPEPLVDNVDVETYKAASGETPASVLPKLIRAEPDALVVRDLPNAETVNIVCAEAADKRLMIAGIRAKEAVEALMRVLLLKVPADKFAPVVTAVLNQRLIRKLCDTCKEGYSPAPDLLKKLGIPAGRVDALFREPKQSEDPCPDCAGIGYKGRTSIFELLIVDQNVRNAMIKQPKMEVLRAAARKAGCRPLQQEGIVLVARGITSLAELTRVLKQ